jgi:trehalose 6-phosphate phosphatase
VVTGAADTPKFDRRTEALLLDIDGTVLDIAPRPDMVCVPHTLVESIKSLFEETGGAVAFVSGRRIADIDRLFSPLTLPAVGCHGGEVRTEPKGEILQEEFIPPAIKERLAEKIARVAPHVRFEDKEHTLAFHFRAAPEEGPSLQHALFEERTALAAADLQLLSGKAVIEIKPRWFNKGTGVSHLMRQKPFSARVPVFLGDDETDHDVFRALAEYRGVGYGVARDMPDSAFTFESPNDVRLWLEALARR